MMETGNNTVDEKQFSEEKPKMEFELEPSGFEDIYAENSIHPTAIIGSDVKMGKGNVVGAYCVIVGNIIIGDNNTFVGFCSIGTEPEHKNYFGKPNKGVFIGDKNVFREYVTVNSGCEKQTIIENSCILLRGSHVGHDSRICSESTLSCNVLVGGHSLVGYGVNMGLGSICHQYSKIGSHSMIGMGAIITKKTNVECFSKYVGNPARRIGDNLLKVEKISIEETNFIFEQFEAMKNEW